MVDLDLIFISLICEAEEEENDEERKNIRKRKRNIWVHDLWKKRKRFGQYETFCKDLYLYPLIFYDFYKMNYNKFDKLVHILRPHIQKQETNFRMPISVEERLSICLRFLTTAISCKALAHEYRLGYCTVSVIINETCAVIWKFLQPLVMPKPTPEMWNKIEKDFQRLWNFPNCIGAIDGKHVNIRAPWNSGSLYYNYKKFFSTVLLAVADAKYKFIIVDIGAYGRNSDGGILTSSKLGQLLRDKKLGIPPNKSLPGTTEELPHVFVGDEAFPLTEHLMRPYPGNQVSDNVEKKIYNYRLSRARRVVESSFGILMQKFEVFKKKIRMQPKYLDTMILACTCLHNYIIDDGDNYVQIGNETQSENVLISSRNSILQNITSVIRREDNEIGIRDKFKTYFNSQNGAVSWQNEIIRRC